MEHSELFTLLETLEIPVAYGHFDVKQNVSPPFAMLRNGNTCVLSSRYRPVSVSEMSRKSHATACECAQS